MNNRHEWLVGEIEKIYYSIFKTGITCLEIEKIISKHYYYSYLYAKNVLKKSFPLGEKAIAQDANCSYWYSMLLFNRFKLGENVLYKYMYSAQFYTRDVLRYNHE